MFEGLLSPTHLIIILAIALVVFGPSQLPQLGRALGQSLRALSTNTRSAASRRFVALTVAKLRTCSAIRSANSTCVVMIDGLAFQEHCALLALGRARRRTPGWPRRCSPT